MSLSIRLPVQAPRWPLDRHIQTRSLPKTTRTSPENMYPGRDTWLGRGPARATAKPTKLLNPPNPPRDERLLALANADRGFAILLSAKLPLEAVTFAMAVSGQSLGRRQQLQAHV